VAVIGPEVIHYEFAIQEAVPGAIVTAGPSAFLIRVREARTEAGALLALLVERARPGAPEEILRDVGLDMPLRVHRTVLDREGAAGAL
jgi:hypothetical protein